MKDNSITLIADNDPINDTLDNDYTAILSFSSSWQDFNDKCSNPDTTHLIVGGTVCVVTPDKHFTYHLKLIDGNWKPIGIIDNFAKK